MDCSLLLYSSGAKGEFFSLVASDMVEGDCSSNRLARTRENSHPCDEYYSTQLYSTQLNSNQIELIRVGKSKCELVYLGVNLN